MRRRQVLLLIEAALTADDLDYARRAAEALLRVWPHDPDGLWGLGRALARSEPRAAGEHLRALLAADPLRPGAQALRGELLARANDARGALTAYASALALAPDRSDWRRQLERLGAAPYWLEGAAQSARRA